MIHFYKRLRIGQMSTVISTSNDILMPRFPTTTTIGINKMSTEIQIKIFGLMDNKDLANVVRT